MGVNIEGLSRGAVLAALYNSSRPQGLGILHFDPRPMTAEEAEKELAASPWVDYLKGRVVKVNLPEGATEFSEHLYDRDLGAGAAERAVATLRGVKS